MGIEIFDPVYKAKVEAAQKEREANMTPEEKAERDSEMLKFNDSCGVWHSDCVFKPEQRSR